MMHTVPASARVRFPITNAKLQTRASFLLLCTIVASTIVFCIIGAHHCFTLPFRRQFRTILPFSSSHWKRCNNEGSFFRCRMKYSTAGSCGNLSPKASTTSPFQNEKQRAKGTFWVIVQVQSFTRTYEGRWIKTQPMAVSSYQC